MPQDKRLRRSVAVRSVTLCGAEKGWWSISSAEVGYFGSILICKDGKPEIYGCLFTRLQARAVRPAFEFKLNTGSLIMITMGFTGAQGPLGEKKP